MKPETGAILAMVSLPDFDPGNVRNSYEKISANHAILDEFEPGSIMKPTHVLEGHIGKVYVDDSKGNESVAQLEISFYLLKKEKRDKKILFGKTYTASKPMDSATTEDYFKALEIALTEVLQQYEKESAALLE